MNNVIMKINRLIGLPREYNPSPLFREESWTQVGQFDEIDGTDSDTRLGRVVTTGGCMIKFSDAVGDPAGAAIQYFGSGVLDIPYFVIEPGKQYIVSYYLSYSNSNDPAFVSTTKVYLGSQSTAANSVSSSNVTGLIEGVVTASESELWIYGYADQMANWGMTYLSIKEYVADALDQIDLIEDISFPIVYQLDDISNPEKKKSSFSRTITLPGTKNNNKIFQHIFDIESDSNFNPNKSLPITVYSDTVEIFKGILKLDSIYHNDIGQIQYDVTLLSNITDLLYTLIAEKELEDLDFSEWNHTYNATNQVNSWGPDFGTGNLIKWGSNYSGFNGSNPKGEGYVYVLMNNGLGTMFDAVRTINGVRDEANPITGPSFRTTDIFPGIYAREILMKIFKGANKTWNSNFLDSNLFRKLVIPYSDCKLELSTAQMVSRTFNALSTPVTLPITTADAAASTLKYVQPLYTNDSTGGGFDGSNSDYNTGNSVWYCVKGGIYDFTANVSFLNTYSGLLTVTGSVPSLSSYVNTNFYHSSAKIVLWKRSADGTIYTNISETTIGTQSFDLNDLVGSTGTSSRSASYSVSATNQYMTTGEQIYVQCEITHGLQSNSIYNTVAEISGSFPNYVITSVNKPVPGLFYQILPSNKYTVISRFRQTDIDGLFTQDVGDKYLVIDGANAGKIATWDVTLVWLYSIPDLHSKINITNLIHPLTSSLNSLSSIYIRVESGGIQTGSYPNVPVYGQYRYVPTYWRSNRHAKLDESIWATYTEAEKLSLGGSANLVINDISHNFYNEAVSTGISDGDEIDINAVVPKNIKQKDFLLSLVKMFNLFMTIDPTDSNIINIEPRDDFYSDDYIDTWEFDLEQEIKIEPLSQLDAKKYNFLYTNDDDYINKDYIDRFDSKEKRAWGHFSAEYDNDFLDGENDIKIIFSPTPVDRPYANKTAMPSITNENQAPFGKSNIRILFYNGRDTREPQWNHIYQVGQTTNVTSRYLPAFNMYDDMFYPSNSLVWGNNGTSYYWASAGPSETYKLNITPQTLYNKYWSNYMRDISDKNSRLITANVKLTPTDINNLDFSKLYYINNHWLRLNRVIDYDASSNETTRCEFLKYNGGRGFTGSYVASATMSGGVGFSGGGVKWTNTGIGTIRIPRDPIKAIDIVGPNGGVKSNTITAVMVTGVANNIHKNTERIRIVGDENIINSGVKRTEIINSNRVTINSDLENVMVINTNDVVVTESNVTYINGVKFKNGSQILESNTGNITKLDGGYDELTNINSINEVDLIDGGLDELRPRGSFTNINKVEGGYNEDRRGQI